MNNEKFKLLFQIMKKNNFSNINIFIYQQEKFPKDKMNDFFEFYNWLKPLFSFHKINKDEKKLLSLFFKETIKLKFEDKKKIIIQNPCFTYFLKINEFNKYILEENNDDDDWWMFKATFNKEYKKLKIDISNKSPSLPQSGRYMLNNSFISLKVISNLLENLCIQDFCSLDGTYFSWDEFINLIKKAKHDPKIYLLDLATKTDWVGTQAIIDGICKSNNLNNLNNKNDLNNKFNKIKIEQMSKSKDLKTYEMKFKIPREEIKKSYEKINNIYELFLLPKELKNKSFISQIISAKSYDINYDTTQVDENYFSMFNMSMNIFYDYYKNYLKWSENNSKKIIFYNSNKLEKINTYLLEWIIQKDIDISGYIALKILKESILLLFPNNKTDLKNKNYYQMIKLAANQLNQNYIKWSTEILFAPTSHFWRARNKICHFDNSNNMIINFTIVCLAIEFIRSYSKLNKITI